MVCKRSDQNIYTISYKSVYLIQKQKCPTGTEKRRWLVINLVPPFQTINNVIFFFLVSFLVNMNGNLCCIQQIILQKNSWLDIQGQICIFALFRTRKREITEL